MMFMYKHSLIILITIISVIHPVYGSDDASSYQLKLDEIRDKISTVLSNLQETQDKRSDVRDELQKLERKIARTSKSLRTTKRKHRNAGKKLTDLRAELVTLNKELKKQRQVLSSQLRSAHAMGQQAQLKMLFNQQQPSELGRSMVYYRYLNQARSAEISSFLERIDARMKLEQSIAATKQELEQLLLTKNKQHQTLKSNRKSRKQLLNKLNQDIEHQNYTLDELKSSRNRIESLLMSLGEILADIPSQTQNQLPFSGLKGKLPWPVKGTFSAQFGTPRHQGDLIWNGVVIKAAYGTPVRAISHGQIAFSDWLQGFGFITIVDHNDGYMSLYGHNQELFKQAGDWIEPGEILATVGDSGGQSESGLYFELRHQGKPVNPSLWCNNKIRHIALKDN